ncbi:MAG TPA: TIM barrel protein [Fimbriimonas sp.]
MRFGVCCSLAEAPAVLDAGFDFVELAAVGFAGMEDAWDPRPYQDVPIECTNVFFPGSIRLAGLDATDYRPYARRTIERAAAIGVATMVVGSGGSRRAPDGIDGEAIFIDVCRNLQSIADQHGLRIAPESLNQSETNVGNDLRTLALSLQSIGVDYTADSYHVLWEWNAAGRPGTISNLWAYQVPIRPRHVHLARLESRSAPTPDDPELQAFASRLAELGYDGTVSLECSRPDGFDFRQALRDVKELFGTVGGA